MDYLLLFRLSASPTVSLDLLRENRNFRDLYWLEIPKGANVPIKQVEMLFISRVPSVVIISVVTCRDCAFTRDAMTEKRAARRGRNEGLERTGEAQKGWRDAD